MPFPTGLSLISAAPVVISRVWFGVQIRVSTCADVLGSPFHWVRMNMSGWIAGNAGANKFSQTPMMLYFPEGSTMNWSAIIDQSTVGDIFRFQIIGVLRTTACSRFAELDSKAHCYPCAHRKPSTPL